MKKILSWVILILAMIGIINILSIFKKDEYIGFFYPDSNNLFYDIQSDQVFEDLDSCRTWVQVQTLENATEILSNNYKPDYECGKNCDISGGKPYVCEETLK
jgi:hypothetical protein